jgi:hypothetical protein
MGLQGPPGQPGAEGTTQILSSTGAGVDLRIIARDVATLVVPAGNFWLVFTSTLTNTTADLLHPTDSIACAFVGFSTPNIVRLGSDANQAVMSLQTIESFAIPTAVTVRCQGSTLQFSGRSENNVLTAVKFGGS